jgi:D-3-phosphoglycerate dehydrogenase
MAENSALAPGGARDMPSARRLKVVFVPHPYRPELFRPWGEDVVTALAGRHDFNMLDLAAPLGPQFADADVVVDHGGQARTPEMAEACTSAKLWQILGTGFDHFDVGLWKSLGIPVANCPGAFSAVSLAEGAVMLMLMLARRYPVARERLFEGRMYDTMGSELEGLSLGLVGFGASAKALAVRARAFGMRISAVDIREVGADEVAECGLSWLGRPDELDGMLGSCDVVSLHLHLNDETRHTIDERRLGLMRRGAFLINVARGELVDEATLERALLSGRLGGAGLDVFGVEPPDVDRPIFALPNVIALPHVAAATDGTSRKRAECVAENIDRVARGLEPSYRVDL